MGLAALATLGSCDFDFPPRFRSFGFADSLGSADSIRSSWFSSPGGAGFVHSEPSQLVPHYSDIGSSYPFDSLKHGTDHIPIFKKIPTEDKALKKKAVPPFYTLPDDPKMKEMILKSGEPYCQEITPKDSKAGATASSKAGVDEKQMTCYRCKDPKNGSTYEHCSYTSQPQQEQQEQQHRSRGARSNAAVEKSPTDSLSAGSHPSSKSSHGSSSDESTEKLPGAFRFSEDYFHPEASHDLPTEYEKNIDNCERVVKDSMVCMVCKDPKTSGKYEQCSYVAQPHEKAYAYSKSSSFGGAKQPKDAVKKSSKHKQPEESRHRPRKHESEEEGSGDEEDHHDHHEPEANHHQNYKQPHEEHSWSDEDKEGHGSHYVPEHTYHYPSYKDYSKPSSYGSSYEAADEAEEDAAATAKQSTNCKPVQKDGQSCTVCTNPKTGGKSEQCTYSHEPKDKVYKYSKSKSFGYPESQKSSSAPAAATRKSDHHDEHHHDDHHDDHEDEKSPESSEKQEQQHHQDGSGESSGYGSYESEPSTLDYIRSESEKISEQVKGKGDCRKVKRDDEVCTICKDPKTGGENEQCNYSYEPEDKVFAYSKSKSFGSPTEYGSSSSEEHPEESYSLPVIYPTGTSPLDYIPKTSESQLSSVYTTRRPQVASSTTLRRTTKRPAY